MQTNAKMTSMVNACLNLPVPDRFLRRSAYKLLILLFGAENRTANEAMLKERFVAIAAEHDSMIRRICFGYSRTKEEMEDLCQDVLLNIWRALPKFRGDSSVKTWIYRIALNTCVSTIRKMPKTTYNNLPEIIDESDERRRRVMELHDMISLLPPVDKAVVLLWLDETSYDEIAAITGLSRNTVATRLRRAKEKLKNL